MTLLNGLFEAESKLIQYKCDVPKTRFGNNITFKSQQIPYYPDIYKTTYFAAWFNFLQLVLNILQGKILQNKMRRDYL